MFWATDGPVNWQIVAVGSAEALVTLLLANELPRFHALGLAFKFALLGLCWLSFFAYVIPILVGSVGTGVFLLSMLAGCLPLAAVDTALRGLERERPAIRRGTNHRSADLRAECSRDHARGDRRRRA